MESVSTKSRINKCSLRLGALCLVGLAISVYGYYVEVSAEGNENFRAMCDISEKISCSKVFSSRYGKSFGLLDPSSKLNIPNGAFGLVHYTLCTLLAFSSRKSLFNVFFGLVVASNLMTIYLAYLLIFVIENMCVVCVSLYLVNALMLVGSLQKRKLLRSGGKERND